MANWKNDYSRYKGYFLNIYEAYQKKRDVMMFLEILLSMATIAVLAVFALRPTAITIIALVKEIKAKEELVEQMNTKIQNLSTAQSLYSREARRISLLNQAIPDKPNMDIFHKQILAAYAQNGVIPETIVSEEIYLVGEPAQTRSEKTFENVHPVPITSQSESSYAAIKNLITQLERLRRPFHLTQLSLAPENDEDSNLMFFNVSGNMYYFVDTTPEESTPSGELDQDI